MNNKSKYMSPVAVGGVGGSGTRVVAEILIQLGFYMGNDLNAAYDNLWFTLLFKRPDWFFKKLNSRESQIFKGINIFENTMTGTLSSKYNELIFIMKAAVEMMFKGQDHLGSGKGLWPLKRVLTMIQSKKRYPFKDIGWGWKEPNTHIYIEYLSRYFDNLKYIHVIRHGLDMAYSSNQAQLYNWGIMFGVEANNLSTPLPILSLKYWNEANKRAVALGKKLFNERFLVINFEKLCINPEDEISLLIDFLKIDKKKLDINELAKLPKLPKSAGRYKNYDLTIFSKNEIDTVRDLGFEVDK